MSTGWTAERRSRQGKLIHIWRPWEKSTGPKTVQGKRGSAMRGYKGGVRPTLGAFARALRAQRDALALHRQPSIAGWTERWTNKIYPY